MDAAGTLCRDCGNAQKTASPKPRCPECGSPRLLSHDELFALTIAHVDCDAFYASVEKRDNPELADKALIIGGGQRGVVSTCCYIARQSGVRSAMPAFTAKRLCPDAVFVKPDMQKYVAVSRQIRQLMDEITPLVQPISIDEAFLDLTGTEKLHKSSAAETLARFANRVKDEIGVTISVGLSHNKFLAKIASDLDKPRGFAIIGKAETKSFLAPKPISTIYGVGKVFSENLRKQGFITIGQLQNHPGEDLHRRFGEMGLRLARLANGEDTRAINTDTSMKTVSNESTFFDDKSDFEELARQLLKLCEKLSERLKSKNLVGDTVTLKLKTAGFKLRTRARHLMMPTQLAHTLYETGTDLLRRETDGTAFRLIGIGVSGLDESTGDDPVDLIEPAIARKAAAERAMDKVRNKFGREAVIRGKLYRGSEPAKQTKRDQQPEQKDAP